MMSYYDVINPFFVNIGATYELYHQFIDPIVAFMIFLAVSQWVYVQIYARKDSHNREAKMLGVAVALALTFGFAVFESRTGFYFGHPTMMGLGAIILLLLFGALIYWGIKALTGEENKKCAFAFTYFLMYSIFLFPFHALHAFMRQEFRFLSAMLGLGFILALIAAIVCLIKGLFGGGGHHREEEEAPHTTPHATTPTTTTTPNTTGHPITIRLTPGNGSTHPVGHPIRIEAHISGGNNSYVWQFTPNTVQPHQGRGNHAVASVMLPAGTHRIAITVRDPTDPNIHADAHSDIVVTANPTPSPSALRDIHAFQQLVQRYVQLSQDLVRHGNTLLDAHNQATRHGGQLQPVQAAMTQFTQTFSALQQVVIDMQRAAPSIVNHPGLATLTQQQRQQLGNIYNAYNRVSHTVSSYMVHFQDCYNRNLNHRGQP